MTDFNWSHQFHHKDDTYRPHYLVRGSSWVPCLWWVATLTFCAGVLWAFGGVACRLFHFG